MIVAVDTETYQLNKEKTAYEPILDTNQYIIGCLIKDTTPNTPELYTDKRKLWKRIIDLGKKVATQGKILSVYAFHHIYDFTAYGNYQDQHLRLISDNPFIYNYNLTKEECKEQNIKPPKEREKTIIKFLDAKNIFTGNLKNLGNTIGHQKLKMPKKLHKNKKKLIQQIKPYVTRDTQIVLKSIEHLKNKLKKDEIQLKYLISASQIGVSYILNKLRKLPDNQTKHIYYNKIFNRVHWTKHPKKIHAAYKGGRVEAFQTGNFTNTTSIDVNSLYPYILINMKIPDLTTENYLKHPLRYLKPNYLLQKTGIARAMIKNTNDQIGILQNRLESNYYTKPNQYAIGTWTLQELQHAKNNNYKIIDIEWAIIYDNSEHNPFQQIYTQIYEKRKKEKNLFNNLFYKNIMNMSIGKFAQYRTTETNIIDSIEKRYQYLEAGYKMTRGIGKTNVLYTKESNITKKYYMPIIPTLVNAQARLYMNKAYQKIGTKNLLYTDTDSITLKGNIPKEINTGNNLGQFKITEKNVETQIYARKTYRIGEKLKASGIKINEIQKADFIQGNIQTTRMNTIKNSNDLRQLGKFQTIHRNLKEEQKNYENQKQEIETQRIIIDKDITDYNYFIDQINQILNQNN